MGFDKRFEIETDSTGENAVGVQSAGMRFARAGDDCIDVISGDACEGERLFQIFQRLGEEAGLESGEIGLSAQRGEVFVFDVAGAGWELRERLSEQLLRGKARCAAKECGDDASRR